jgi:hypothetical protein
LKAGAAVITAHWLFSWRKYAHNRASKHAWRIRLHFEHLIEINDPLDPSLEPLTADQLWQGLVLRAREPAEFMLGLDRALILAEVDNVLQRELHFGAARIRDTVTLTPKREVQYDTHATAEHAGGSLTMTIEQNDAAGLFVRFIYNTTMADVEPGGDSRYADIVCSAYHEADVDTVRKIRELASLGRLG